MLCLSGFKLYSRWVPLLRCLSKSVENNLDEQTVVLIFAVNRDKYKKESSRILECFLRQEFSFVTKLMA